MNNDQFFTVHIIENRIIESLIRDGIRAYEQISGFISENDFQHPVFKKCYQILKSHFDNEERIIDRGLLMSELQKTDLDLNLFDVKEVEKWADLQIYTSNIRDFGLSLKETAQKNNIDTVLFEMRDFLHKNSGKPSQSLLGEIRNIFSKIENLETQTILSDAINVSNDYFHQIEEGKTEKKISTGFVLLDQALKGGYTNGSLNMIGARPSVGKSLLALQIVHNILKNEKDLKPILFFSLEMGKYEIISRSFSYFARADIEEIEQQKLSPEQYRNLIVGVKDHYSHEDADPRLLICDESLLTIEKLKDVAIEQFKKFSGLGAIVLDYLQLIDLDTKKQNLTTAMGYVTRSLKILASKCNCPVIALSQLNREAEKSVIPKLSDFRDSGNIESDANTAVIIRKDETDETSREIHLLKNRGGSLVKFKVPFYGKYSCFDLYGVDIKK